MSRIIPLEDFFRNSEHTGYQLSPDGRHISWVAPVDGRMNIFVSDVDHPEGALQLTFEKDRSVAGYFWADNERLLFMRDVAGDENYALYGVRRDGTEMKAYTNFPGVRTTLIDDLEECPDEVMIGLNRRNPEVFDPFRLNIRTGELTQLAENPGNWQGWMTDHHGRLRSVTAIVDGVNVQILYRETEEEEFKPVLTTNFKEHVGFLGFTPDDKMVYAITNLHRDRTALVLMDPRTCEEKELLFEHERYDISSISYSRKRKKLLAAFCSGHKEPVRHFFDEEEEAFRTRLKAFFPGMRVGIADTDKEEERYLFYAGNDRTRGAYYYYDIHEEAPRKIADTAPWIKPEEMVPMIPFIYYTRDGLEIEAYLSVPHPAHVETEKGDVQTYDSLDDLVTPEKPLPVVVHPHGGPWARDYWGYQAEVQFLCNRGYAVLQMNFRGSTGRGRRFLESSFKQWGLSMQDDITDGVQYLIEKGIADARRIAIYGGSYGGYAVLAGLTLTPDLYCCGIDYCGVSNLFTFMKTIPPYWRPMLEMMYEQVGHPEKDRAQLEATSPALHADAIKVPLLIAQGANDPRVNKAESDQMVEALRKRGISVEYMVKDNEGHGFHNQENRFDFYRAMERFLKEHL